MARVLSPVEQDAFEPVQMRELMGTFIGIAASKAKNLFGSLIERSAAQPVILVKNDRPSAIVVSPETFIAYRREHEELITLRAMLAEREGYLSAEETDAFFDAAERRLAEKNFPPCNGSQ